SICLSVNDGFCETAGYQREEVINRSILELNLWANKRDRGKLIRALKRDGYISNLNAEFRRKDGSVWPGMMSACLAEMQGKSVVLSATKDVSDMRRAQDQAIQANLAKSQFLSSMSHELRTPLNAILGFAQLLQFNQTEPLSVSQRQSIDLIESSGQHLLQLINQILDLSGIETGNLEVLQEEVQLQEIIEECVAVTEAMAETESIGIENATKGIDYPVILADPLRLKQVLLNLLSNALKYSSAGCRIRVEAEILKHRFMRIRVMDQGPGISNRDQAELFEPFKRFGPATDQIPGAGIGLSISKQLITAMQGKIGFDSIPGEGSVFWFDLPLADGSKTVIGPSNGETCDRETQTTDLPINQGTVLYIEDNPVNVDFMKLFFEDLVSVDLTIATSAKAGLKLAEEIQPDLVLMDIGLPDIDGIEATRLLKAQKITESIPVIALSAAAMQGDIERAREVDFYAYVTKPIQFDPFLKLLNEVLSPPSK
ncbi:MAG: ATP-binding protein, partial [Pseudomonadota bacterium]